MARSLEKSRLELHAKLLELVGNVYFQPPESIKLKYPCIIYNLEMVQQRHADDISYRRLPRYSVTIIDRNAEIDWVTKMLDKFAYCSMERQYIADNLEHYAFNLYYL